MSRVRIAVFSLIAFAVIAVGVGVGVTVALNHRDAQQAAAAHAAIQTAADAAEQERAESCEAYVSTFTDLIEEHIGRRDVPGTRSLAESIPESLTAHDCGPEAAEFRDRYLTVADEIYEQNAAG